MAGLRQTERLAQARTAQATTQPIICTCFTWHISEGGISNNTCRPGSTALLLRTSDVWQISRRSSPRGLMSMKLRHLLWAATIPSYFIPTPVKIFLRTRFERFPIVVTNLTKNAIYALERLNWLKYALQRAKIEYEANSEQSWIFWTYRAYMGLSFHKLSKLSGTLNIMILVCENDQIFITYLIHCYFLNLHNQVI